MRRGPRFVLGAAWLALAGVAFVPVAAADQQPRRIVSIGGAVTEIVYALGAGEHLVAVDSTSSYPAAARQLPDVGYMRALAAEPILALAPDLVLAAADAGPPVVLRQLKAAGVGVVTIAEDPSPAGVVAKIHAVAAALGRPQAGQRLAARVAAAFAAVRSKVSAVLASHDRPRVLFLLSAGSGSPLAAGTGTSAERIIRLAGGDNAIRGYRGYKPLAPEALVAAAPDVLLVAERTLDILGGARSLLARPAIAATPAGRNRRLVAMDGLLLLGFGPRTPAAIATLATQLHPDAARLDPATQAAR